MLNCSDYGLSISVFCGMQSLSVDHFLFIFQEHVIAKGLVHKVPKVVAASVDILFQAVRWALRTHQISSERIWQLDEH